MFSGEMGRLGRVWAEGTAVSARNQKSVRGTREGCLAESGQC